MFTTKPKVLQHVLKILEIETKVNNILLAQGIDYVRCMIHYKYNIYRKLVYKLHSKLFMVDLDQTFIFQQWHPTTFIRSPATIYVNYSFSVTM